MIQDYHIEDKMKVIRYCVELDLSVEGKHRCPKCANEGRDRSGDNLHIFGLDGDGGHFF